MTRLLCVLAAATFFARTAGAQPSYARAERYLPWHANKLVTGDSVDANWFEDGNRFWYRNKGAPGAEWWLVDPVRNTKTPLWDNARLAAAMSRARDTSYDPAKLPIRGFKFGDDGRDEGRIEFNATKKRFTCDIHAYTCSATDTLPSEVPFVKSPDRQWEAFVSKNNLWVRRTGGRDSVQLTTDGEEYWAYGLTAPRPGDLARPQPRRPQLRWSPDSKRILVGRLDERGVAMMPYYSSTAQRPKLYQQPYALPGDSIVPKPGAAIVDVATKASRALALPSEAGQLFLTGSLVDSAWSPGSDRVDLAWLSRGSRRLSLGEADAATGQVRVVAGDSSRTWVEFNPRDGASWYVTSDGKEVIWWSERDGWGHLYLYGTDGTLKGQITSGAWMVGAVVSVDEKTRQIYFTARGREAGRLPYYAQVYRVGFDGAGLTLLTPEDGNHEVEFSPSGRFFTDTWSRVDVPSKTVLRAAPDGRVVRELEAADVTRLREIGWKPAQVFMVKARDGVTDLYGVLYLPPNLDTTKTYPVISHIYPGPQVGSVGNWSFKGGSEPYSLAELGFVVMQLDHLGTPLRSKAFHDAYYGNFIDNGIEDHVAAIKQLASRYRWIDLDRVGIFGHSGGGFASTDAILRFPDFFKVAVSGAGNHDNRSYNIYWAEKYQGLMVRDTARKTDNFATSANASYAKNLKGKLLLMHGDMDDNVHPAMTIQLVDALIKANRSFDLIIAPNRAHSLNEPYFIRRRWDYFVQYLLGVKPPDNYEITKPEDQ